MNNADDKMVSTVIAALACLTVGFVIGAIVAGEQAEKLWEKETTAHQCAHYDTTSGKWGWNEDKP
jgi:Na+/glutamate symporter